MLIAVGFSLGVWFIYTLDHLLDAIKLKENVSTRRHTAHYINRTNIKILLVLVAVILGIIYYSFEFQSSHIILIGALASIGIFLATTIPNKSGTFFTDRKRYQRLTSNGKEQDVELAVLRILGNYGKDNSYINVNPNDIETIISDDHYKYFGLFTKLTYQFETNGHFELETENEFEKTSKTMPKSLVKAMKMQLDQVTK